MQCHVSDYSQATMSSDIFLGDGESRVTSLRVAAIFELRTAAP